MTQAVLLTAALHEDHLGIVQAMAKREVPSIGCPLCHQAALDYIDKLEARLAESTSAQGGE